MSLILVVEDDWAIREGICDILELGGYEVVSAVNGQEALAVLMGILPDLIISDIAMPVMDGYEFYRAVRRNENWLAVPFIFLTAKDQRADVRLGRELGADDYLTKPFEREDLLVAVAAKLRRAVEFQQPTQKKMAELQEHLTRTDRMATIGQLAAEFAHEIKNPLTAIAMYAEFAQRDLRMSDPSLAQDMGQIVEQSERIASQISDLLSFSRQIPRLWVDVDILNLLDQVLNLVRFRLLNISLVRQYHAQARAVRGDPARLQQVFLNLIVNAVQAMPSGGQLSLSTRDVLIDQLPGLAIAVSDTGCGIAPEHLGRIFEAYFTTKKAGEGTGLGLYVCKNIIEQHGGHIDLQSQAGVGTTFTVHLPLLPSASNLPADAS